MDQTEDNRLAMRQLNLAVLPLPLPESLSRLCIILTRIDISIQEPFITVADATAMAIPIDAATITIDH